MPLDAQAARSLLTLDDKDTKRLFEGEALLRRMYKYGLLDESQSKLDYVLAMTPQDFLERRLQTLVFKLGLAKSMHHARVLIRQRHIRCVFLALSLRLQSDLRSCNCGACIEDWMFSVWWHPLHTLLPVPH